MNVKTVMLIFLTFVLSADLMAQADMQETVNLIKSNLAASAANIKKYEWIETITAFYKGEQKSKKQNQCYYAVDGKLTKVETGGSTEPSKTPGGIRGRIVENKVDDISTYITKAVDKIHAYLPPDGNKIQQIYASGGVSIGVLEPGKKFRLDFPNYLEEGDLLSVSIDTEHKLILALAVKTSVDTPSDKVNFDIGYNALPDGTQYAGITTLDAKAKEVKITIENSGFKKGAGQ